MVSVAFCLQCRVPEGGERKRPGRYSMREIKCVLADGDVDGRAPFKSALRRCPRIQLMCEAGSLDELLRVVEIKRPDCLFLEADLLRGAGYERLRGMTNRPMIIMLSRNGRQAVRAFDLGAIDYLLKPVDPVRLHEALGRLRMCCTRGAFAPACRSLSLTLQQDDVVTIDAGRVKKSVPVKNLLMIKADRNYAEVLLADGTRLLVRQTMGNWMARLPPSLFLRVDRKLILNTSHIRDSRRQGRGRVLILGPKSIQVKVGRMAAERMRASQH